MTLLIIAICVLLSITFFTEKGEAGWAFFLFLCFASFVLFIDKTVTINDIVVGFKENSGLIVTIAMGYILVGVMWSIFKWKKYCVNYYSGDRPEYFSNGLYIRKLYASSNKARITGWMIWWPTSLVWWLIHDPITRFYNFLYDSLIAVFDSIAESERQRHLKQKD